MFFQVMALMVGCAGTETDKREAAVDDDWWVVPGADEDWNESTVDDDEEEDDDEGTGDFIGFWGEGSLAEDGTLTNVWGDYSVYIEGEEGCYITWDAVAIEAGDCENCQFSYRLTMGNIEGEVDDNCESHGMTAGTLDGYVLPVGLDAEEVAYSIEGDSWVQMGEFAYDQESGEFEFEIVLSEE